MRDLIESYFIDPVHLSDRGRDRRARFYADRILPIFSDGQ